jgi:hypothetical protein
MFIILINSLLLLLFSLDIVLFRKEIAMFLDHTYQFLNAINHWATKIFAGDTGRIISETLTLFIVPVLIALIPYGIYWAFKRKHFVYFPHVLWAIWIMMATVMAIHR